MTLLPNKFAQIASKIDATNAQIATLQAKLSASSKTISNSCLAQIANPPIASGI